MVDVTALTPVTKTMRVRPSPRYQRVSTDAKMPGRAQIIHDASYHSHLSQSLPPPRLKCLPVPSE
jgi:hypothetical protein